MDYIYLHSRIWGYFLFVERNTWFSKVNVIGKLSEGMYLCDTFK